MHCWRDPGYGEFELSEVRPDPALDHFAALLGGVPRVQVVRTPGVDRTVRGTRVVSASRLLGGLP